MKIISYGCDPEIFLQDNTGKIKSGIGLFGGTKKEPKPLPLGDGFAVQEDNILMEFNIPPAKTPDMFVSHVQKTVEHLSRYAATKGLSFAKGSAYSVDKAELNHPKALEFGCEPDFNAYTGEANPRPKAEDECLRSAGGHIAVGVEYPRSNMTEKQIEERQRSLVCVMDMVLGIPSILLDEGVKRKLLYGKAGAFRPKPFGVEYRTLSNFWVFNGALTEAFLNDLATTIEIHHGVPHNMWNLNYSEMIELAINENNTDFAKWFMFNNRSFYRNISKHIS